MDKEQARDQLESIRQARTAAARPPLPLSIALTSAVAVGVGVALAGQSAGGAARLLLRLAAIALLALAFTLPNRHRRGQGLFGYQGPVQSENTTFLICAAALFIIGLNASPTLGLIYAGLGVVAAVAYFLTLTGRLRGDR